MNADELRAAAEYVLKPPRGAEAIDIYEEAAKLARHVQRMYDESPVDEAYAESIAIEVSQGKSYYTSAEVSASR